MWSESGYGLYTAAESHLFYQHRLARMGDSRAVYYSHHRTDSAFGVRDENAVRPITDRRLAIMSCDFFGDPGSVGQAWGNADSVTKVALGRSYAASRYSVVNDKVLLWGTSMGALHLLNWAKDNVDQIAAMALEIPVLDPQRAYDINPGSIQNSISLAHSGRPTDALTPARHPSAYAGIPGKIWFSDGNLDTYCTDTIANDFAAGSGFELATIGAVGHDLTAVDGDQVADFLEAYAST